MIQKMFVGVGECPYKVGTTVGSVGCRGCKYYFGEPAFSTFVYCKCPPELMEAPKSVKTGKAERQEGGKRQKEARTEQNENEMIDYLCETKSSQIRQILQN